MRKYTEEETKAAAAAKRKRRSEGFRNLNVAMTAMETVLIDRATAFYEHQQDNILLGRSRPTKGRRAELVRLALREWIDRNYPEILEDSSGGES